MTKILSWGKYPYLPQFGSEIYWPDDIFSKYNEMELLGIKSTLAYGAGRSYGDSCLAESNNVLKMQNMDRVLFFNPKIGVISVQSGITIKNLIDLILPYGWFIPVTPGTKFVTLGGAVANDVHGKNHHNSGTFGRFIKKIILYRSDEGLIECSNKKNIDLFNATIGGLGLTGIIISIEFQLKKILSNNIFYSVEQFNSLDDYFDLSLSKDSLNEYSVAWIDCLASGKNIGRGHFISGNHSSEGNLDVINDRKISIPFDLPFSLVNSFNLRIFNEIYFRKYSKGASITNYNNFFYPLDKIGNWNNIYGRKGFQQYQCVIPTLNQRDVIKELLKEVSKKNTGSFLAILKSFGSLISPGILSFPIEGCTLTLDFPQKSIQDNKLFLNLDKIVEGAKGKLYPAKDAHMSSHFFKKMYPNWTIVESKRDPKLLSKFWKRVIF